jgi:hypothetical protein
MKRSLFYLTLCIMLLSYLGCSDECKYDQNIAIVDIVKYVTSSIDSVVMKANDSIIGCPPDHVPIHDAKPIISHRRMIGSTTHHVKFPINVRLQLFSQGDLLKELSFEMKKNTVATVYKGSDCPKDIDTSSDDYCWLLEKMEDTYIDNPYSVYCRYGVDCSTRP